MKRKVTYIKNEISKNITWIIIIIAVVIFLMLCFFYQHRCVEDMRNSLTFTKQILDSGIERSMQKTDYLLSNPDIMEKLDDRFGDGHESIEAIKELNMFMDTFTLTTLSDREEILIYTSNPTLMDSKYLRNISQLDDYSRLLSETRHANRNFTWKDSVAKDLYGDEYITLYRRISLTHDYIVELKIFVDEIINVSQKNSCDIKLVEKAAVDYNFYTVTKPVFGNFVLMGTINVNALWVRFLIYFMFLSIVTAFLISVLKRRGYEGRLLMQKLEIEALNAKVNPHLLYNSLTAIKLVAYNEKNEQIQKITDVLIEYYRLNVNQGRKFISIGKELECLEKYVRIHEISKKRDYDLDIRISEDIYDIEIPHLLLQPLVENSIIHGFKKIETPEIIITVDVVGNMMHIEISDNGIGIDKETLDDINRGIYRGYGIGSVNTRLKFYYKHNYTMKFVSECGRGTKIILEIPTQILNVDEEI